MVVNIIVNYCFTRTLLYAKMLKEIETEEALGFFVIFLSLVAFQWGGGLPASPCYADGWKGIVFEK